MPISPYINRFLQPDSIIPNGNPQSLNRFSYVVNNPLQYTDPTGHAWDDCSRFDSDVECKRHMRHVAKVKARWSAQAAAEANVFDCNSADEECLDAVRHDLYKQGYSAWEVNMLQKLALEGGPDAVHGVNYIVANGVHVTIGIEFQCSKIGSEVTDIGCVGNYQSLGNIDGWYDRGKNTVVLNPNKGYEVGMTPSAWGWRQSFMRQNISNKDD